MHRTHMSIGFAMYYTSVTIIVGFCILIFSNFIPSIYFGILTSIAMLMALLSSLILLINSSHRDEILHRRDSYSINLQEMCILYQQAPAHLT